MKYKLVIKKLLLDITTDIIFYLTDGLVALLTNICKNDALISLCINKQYFSNYE